VDVGIIILWWRPHCSASQSIGQAPHRRMRRCKVGTASPDERTIRPIIVDTAIEFRLHTSTTPPLHNPSFRNRPSLTRKHAFSSVAGAHHATCRFALSNLVVTCDDIRPYRHHCGFARTQRLLCPLCSLIRLREPIVFEFLSGKRQ